MKHFLKIAIFSLITVASFAAYSNFGIPQVQPAPPPREETFDVGDMTPADFIALGEKTFNGKGSCTLCHNSTGRRAPPLQTAATVAAERLADPRYGGQAASEDEYLYESMLDPSAYVVAGFGKAGTGDTVSPMPSMKSGATALSETEIRAVVAFLQDLAGVAVTASIPADTAEHNDPVEALEAARPPLATPQDIIQEFACGACHKVAGEEGDVGPDLTAIGALRDRDYLRRAILTPDADIVPDFEGGVMPADYGQQLYAAELELLVGYLAERK